MFKSVGAPRSDYIVNAKVRAVWLVQVEKIAKDQQWMLFGDDGLQKKLTRQCGIQDRHLLPVLHPWIMKHRVSVRLHQSANGVIENAVRNVLQSIMHPVVPRAGRWVPAAEGQHRLFGH